MVVERGQVLGVWAFKVAEPTEVVLTFKGKAAILQPTVEIEHLVSCVCDSDTWSKEVRRKDHTAVRKPKLCVLEIVTIRLALFVFVTSSEVDSKPASWSLVIFEVTKALAVFTRWHPD